MALSKTGRFLSKAEILGVGVFSPFQENVSAQILHCESADPLQSSKSPNSGKEGVGVNELPFPVAPEKDALSEIIPISLQGTARKMRIFGLKAPFSGAIGIGSFLTPKPSFPDFGDFDLWRGSADSQMLHT